MVNLDAVLLCFENECNVAQCNYAILNIDGYHKMWNISATPLLISHNIPDPIHSFSRAATDT